MKREEFLELLDQTLAEVKALFAVKNASYGADDDVFYNFRSTAERVLGSSGLPEQFQVLMVYLDKHLVALTNRGLAEQECAQRLLDVIVYATIALGMVEEQKHQNAVEALERLDECLSSLPEEPPTQPQAPPKPTGIPSYGPDNFKAPTPQLKGGSQYGPA